MLAKLTSITTGVFGGNTTFKESFDPEYPADKYLELTVRTKLAPEQIVLAETEWIKAMAEIAPAWGDLRLKIVPV